MNYYIADMHFGHENVLKFDNRPFKDIEQCDKQQVENWNNVVGYDDDIYILGDVSWYNATKTNEILDKLNGIKHLIIGNHDGKLLRNADFREHFIEITNYKEIKDGEKDVVMCHYPLFSFNRVYYGAYHLYGHVHNSQEWNMYLAHCKMQKEIWKKFNAYNCGTMCVNYTPKTLDELITMYEDGIYKDYNSADINWRLP